MPLSMDEIIASAQAELALIEQERMTLRTQIGVLDEKASTWRRMLTAAGVKAPLPQRKAAPSGNRGNGWIVSDEGMHRLYAQLVEHIGIGVQFTAPQAQAVWGKSIAYAHKLLKQMRNEGLVVLSGRGEGKGAGFLYELVEQAQAETPEQDNSLDEIARHSPD
jgi:hypothetical protein